MALIFHLFLDDRERFVVKIFVIFAPKPTRRFRLFLDDLFTVFFPVCFKTDQVNFLRAPETSGEDWYEIVGEKYGGMLQ